MILQDEALLKRVEWVIAAIFVALSLGTFALCTTRFALGVLSGEILAIANFYLMKRSLRRALDGHRQGGSRFVYLLKFYLRLAALALMIAALIISGRINPFGLLLGLSIIVMGIVLVGFNEARKLISKGVA
jgi:hypothetical protein